MSMRRLAKAWIFVSHSTKDIHKVRLIRNHLERAGAEPLIFRLKFLENRRSQSIQTLLRAEIKARQFFLLCRSVNAVGSGWVRDEWKFVQQLPGKSIHIIDLDPPPRWTTPRTEIDKVLKLANIAMVYPWAERLRIAVLVREITSTGVAPTPSRGGVSPEADIREEPETIDHGILGIDDRPSRGERDWLDVAIAAADRANTIVLCASNSLTRSPILGWSPEALGRLNEAYSNRIVLDLDQTYGDFSTV